MGTTADDQRRSKIRVDNASIQYSIKEARRQIFESGNGPETVSVNSSLTERSLVPVVVRLILNCMTC